MDHDGKYFTRAAWLYAKHHATVREMRELFKADVNRFHEDIKAAVTKAVLPLTVAEELKDATRSWWLTGESEPENPPYLWLGRKDPEAIVPGELNVHVTMDSKDDADRARVNASKTTVKLPDRCEFTKEGRYFVVTISYGDAEPLAVVVEPLVTILRALHDLGE